MDIDNLIYNLSYDSKIKDVLVNLESSGYWGIALLHNVNRELEFVFTDGDIRRALISGIKIDDSITELIKLKRAYGFKDFISISANASNIEMLSKIDKYGIRQIVLLDENQLFKSVVVREQLIAVKSKSKSAVLMMAGGVGSRLLPLTENTPKPMLPIGDQPFLESQIIKLRDYGFKDFYISVHYLKEKIIDYFKTGVDLGVNIQYLEEKLPMGTIGCVSLMDKFEFDNLVVINGDVFTDTNFKDLLDFHIHSKSLMTMCVKEYEYRLPYGKVISDGLNFIEITEKPLISAFVNAGIYVLNKAIIEFVPKDKRFDITELLDTLKFKKQSIKVYPIQTWMDIGSIDDYTLLYNKMKN